LAVSRRLFQTPLGQALGLGVEARKTALDILNSKINKFGVLKTKLILICLSGVLLGCGGSDETNALVKPEPSSAKKTPSTEFYEAAERGNLDLLKKQIDDGVDIDATKGRDGETALHRAATRGSLEATKLLIEKGANVNIRRTKDGDTPLDLASSRGHEKVAELIKKNGGKTAKELEAEGK